MLRKLLTLALVADLGALECAFVTGEIIKTKVAILGGGLAGTMAARTLAENNITEFLIVEARGELGGRLMSSEFMGQTVELGANWVHGTTNKFTGESNPIWELALNTTSSDYSDVLYFDENGPVTSDADINSAFRKYKMSFVGSSVAAGARLSSGLMDQTMKVGLALNNWTALTPLEQAIEWWGFDWGYGQTPDLSSWIESVVNYNSTFLEWSADNMFVVHQRGFKVIVLGEADIFLRPEQIRFNTTVKNISWSNVGVNISAFNLDGHLYMIEADYAIVTFSIGVLQHDASTLFTPRLPDWKLESIQAFSMSIYPKIFLSFPIKFWNDSQYSLYIDPYSRGRYAVWQDLSLPGFLPDSNIISVTVTDQQSDLVEAQPEEVTKAELMETLGKMYPGVDIAEPNGIFIPRWHSDPLFRGSYSNWPAGYPKALHNQLRAPVGEGRVIFSGEATSYKYYGFLQGAYFEGIRAAEEVLHLLRGGTHIFRTDGVLRGCNGL